MYDTILTDFPKLPGDGSDSERIQRAIDATTNGVLCIPKGAYSIKTPLLIKNRCSLQMHPASRLIAEAEMDFVLTWKPEGDYHALSLFNPDGSVYDNLGLFIRGGDIDGNGMASCFAITNAHHFSLADITFHNGKKYGMYIGGDLGGHIYELVANNIYCKSTMKGLSGNIGIYSDRHDAHFTDCFIIDYTIGMQILGASNRLTRCHIWGGTVPPVSAPMEDWSALYGERKRALQNGVYGKDANQKKIENEVPEMLLGSIAFDIKGFNNILDDCYADTAEIGFNIEASTRMLACNYFNNYLMGLRKSTAIVHTAGQLIVTLSSFYGSCGLEILYEGRDDLLTWTNNIVSGFTLNPFKDRA